METKKTTNKFSAEVRERAVRMVREHQGDHASQWAAIASIAAKIGCTARDAAQLGAAGGARRGRCVRARRRMNASGSRRWSGKTASCGRPTRFCARRRHILPRRSSTAGSSHDRLHRRSSRGARGRADLRGFADRPVDLSGACGDAPRSREGLGEGAARCGLARENPARLRREFPGLWRAQGLAAVDAGGRERGALHGRAADARPWACKAPCAASR